MSQVSVFSAKQSHRQHKTRHEPIWVRFVLIGAALLIIGIFLVLPLVTVFYEALRFGVSRYLEVFSQADAQQSILLTLLVVAIAVPLNTVFGVMAAWLIAKFQFFGRNLLISLIDLPLAVSPVIAGLIFVLLFGRQGFFGEWLGDNNIKIIFALPGIVLATSFVTFSFVARELLPIMQSQGRDEEEAALTLGAKGFMVFWYVTLPNVRWGLLYGIIMCNARAMGEFGAVSVVSGKVRGLTTTLPLQIEMLYNEYNTVAAFALASLLTGLAVLTLVVKTYLEWRVKKAT